MAPTASTSVPPSDPTIQLVNSTMAVTTHAVQTKLNQLLDVVSSPSTGDVDIDKSLDQIRRDLESLTSTQTAEQDGIKKMLEDALNREVLEHLTGQIEEQIDVCINNSVANLVEAELDKYVPKELRDQVDAQRSGLLSLQVDIHNSLSILCINGAILSHDSFPDDIFREARRANSFIKTQKHFGENLHGLLNSKGRPSDTFPKTVNDLLAFDDAKVLQLVKHYNMEKPDPKSKIPNLNWFLREIGVTYQSNLFG